MGTTGLFLLFHVSVVRELQFPKHVQRHTAYLDAISH